LDGVSGCIPLPGRKEGEMNFDNYNVNMLIAVGFALVIFVIMMILAL
jgi:hypothetical protein